MPQLVEEACCGSCAQGKPCEGDAHDHGDEGGCASGVCGMAATDGAMRSQRAAGLGRSAGGLFTDRYHDSGPEALRALLAWRAITPATWFGTTQANREAWARAWVATLALPTAAERNEIVAAVLVVSAAQLGTPVRTGSTETGTPSPDAVPANWSTMTAAERTAWANRYADAHGLTPAERAQLAQRAREADAALVRGLVSEGLGTLREWMRTSSAERIAQIEADATARGAAMAADRASEQRILNELRGGASSSSTTRKKSGGGGVALLALVAVAAKALV